MFPSHDQAEGFVFASEIDYVAGTDNYIITQVDVTFAGALSSPNDTGKIQLNIYEKNPQTGNPGQILATSEVDKDDYSTEIAGSAEYDVLFALDKPLDMTSANGYYLSVGERTETSGTNEILIPVTTAGSVPSAFTRLDNDVETGGAGDLWRPT